MSEITNFKLTKNIRQQIEWLPCFEKIDEIYPISEGFSHQCFRVVTQKKDYFVKYCVDNFTLANPEIGLTCLAAKAMLTPPVFYANKHWLVTDFVEGQTLNFSDIPFNEKITHCVKLMTEFHQLPIYSKQSLSVKLSTLNIASAIDELVGLIHLLLSTEQHNLITQIKGKLCQKLVVNPRVICHGDINFSNVLLGDRAWLIDFECGCLADIEFDIAMMIAVNSSRQKGQVFCVDEIAQHYQKITKTQHKLSLDLIKHYMSFSFFINGLWYLWQALTNNGDYFYYLAEYQFNYFDQQGFFPDNVAEKMHMRKG